MPTLSLEAIAGEMEVELAKLRRLGNRMEAARGVSQSMAMEAQVLLPGFLNRRRPLEYFSVTPSRSQYRASLESISGGMWALIAAGIAAAFLAILSVSDTLMGTSSSSSGSSGGGSSSSAPTGPIAKANENARVAARVAVQSEEAVELLENPPEEMKEEIKAAIKSLDEIIADKFTRFTQTDAELLQQQGLYTWLHTSQSLNEHASRELVEALKISEDTMTEFSKENPDTGRIEKDLGSLKASKVLGDDWDEGLSFNDYVEGFG